MLMSCPVALRGWSGQRETLSDLAETERIKPGFVRVFCQPDLDFFSSCCCSFLAINDFLCASPFRLPFLALPAVAAILSFTWRSDTALHVHP